MDPSPQAMQWRSGARHLGSTTAAPAAVALATALATATTAAAARVVFHSPAVPPSVAACLFADDGAHSGGGGSGSGGGASHSDGPMAVSGRGQRVGGDDVAIGGESLQRQGPRVVFGRRNLTQVYIFLTVCADR